MISETRTLQFDDQELTTAIMPLIKTRGETGPVSQADAKVGISTDINGEITVTISYLGFDGEVNITFSANEVGAAMINHCIESGIPLPRTFQKTVEWRGDNVALIMRHDVTIHDLPDDVT